MEAKALETGRLRRSMLEKSYFKFAYEHDDPSSHPDVSVDALLPLPSALQREREGRLEHIKFPPSYNRLRVSVDEGKVADLLECSIISNSKNVEVYSENGDYICLLRGQQYEEEEGFFVATGDRRSINAVAFSKLSFKFLTTRPVGSGVRVISFVLTMPSDPRPTPKKPEVSEGSNGMAMMLAMLGAAGKAGVPRGHGEPDNLKIPSSTSVPSEAESYASPSSLPPQPPIPGTPGLPMGPEMVSLILSQVSGLLDSKLKPVMVKLDQLESKMERLEGLLLDSSRKEEGDDCIVSVEQLQRAPVGGRVISDEDGGEEVQNPNLIQPALASDMRSLLSALRKEGGA